MSSSAAIREPIQSQALRAQIEATLAHRVPGALTPAARTIRPLRPTGIVEIDHMLHGGVPIGGITEVIGPASSGRTSLALALMGGITCAGQVGAWVDVSDTLVPACAAANGVLLDRMLWVRCSGGTATEATPAAETGLHTVDATRRMAAADKPLGGGCGSPHPRSEGRGLSGAIEGLLAAGEGAVPALFTREASERQSSVRHALRNPKANQSKPGTPGAANWSVGNGSVGNREIAGTICTNGIVATVSPSGRVEQVAYDRLPARRGAQVLKAADRTSTNLVEAHRRPDEAVSTMGHPVVAASPSAGRKLFKVKTKRPWGRLEQAMRSIDLLIQGGGFAAIVLDLGSIGAEFARRIPLATWFRWRAAAERTQMCLVVLTQTPCAGSSAELTMRLGLAGMPAQGTVMEGIGYTAEVVRRRFGEGADAPVVSIDRVQRRKPAGSFRTWQTRTQWAGGRRA